VNAYHNVLPKIDDVSDLASALNDYLRRAMNPRWAAIGVDEPKKDANGESKVNTKVSKRDDESIIYVPKPDGKFQSLVHPVDVAAALANIEAQMKEIKEDLPQLALADIRASGNLTAPGVEAGYSEAIDLITESNGNLDDCLIRAVQMGVSIGALRRYKGFTAFDIGSYDRGDLAFYIKEREVIEDKLSALEKQQAWQASGAPAQKLWELLGATEDEIQEWTALKQQDRLLSILAQRQQLGGGQPGQQPPQLPAGDGAPADAPADTSFSDQEIQQLFDHFKTMPPLKGSKNAGPA
jgi:hypothetical protein